MVEGNAARLSWPTCDRKWRRATRESDWGGSAEGTRPVHGRCVSRKKTCACVAQARRNLGLRLVCTSKAGIYNRGLA